MTGRFSPGFSSMKDTFAKGSFVYIEGNMK